MCVYLSLTASTNSIERLSLWSYLIYSTKINYYEVEWIFDMSAISLKLENVVLVRSIDLNFPLIMIEGWDKN